jgi:NlpC/P60 family putative phage cell wall peptidase
MSDDIAEAIVAEAMRWAGTPYRHQGTRWGVGCDCLGLVRGVWREVYSAEAETPGPYSMDWAETGGGEPLLEAARRHCIEQERAPARGDLILFRWRAGLAVKHAGIMVAPDQFIHAYEGAAVVVSPLAPQWRRRIAGVFSFPPRA